MNSKQLRRSLKVKWLTYYRDNREWIDNLGIWVTSDGQRRPSSGFILGVLSTLEPDLNSLLPLVVDLSSNPDRIIAVLGLNISPAQELKALEKAQRMLPGSDQPEATLASSQPKVIEPVKASPYDDDACTGVGGREDDRPRT
ncbi:MAG: hypothetical protein EA342_19045 [Leptolyngbya sp. LCM1.Bin17]|nr:MAG: hypothetical protein EA342_19045 [Leptolyngbya sp. LCM1.Bin17]